MTIEKKYFEKYWQYCKGEISRDEWCEFCTLILDSLMKENKDILKNLKEI